MTAGIAAPRVRSAWIVHSGIWLTEKFNERLVFVAVLVFLFFGPASGPIAPASTWPDHRFSDRRTPIGERRLSDQPLAGEETGCVVGFWKHAIPV